MKRILAFSAVLLAISCNDNNTKTDKNNTDSTNTTVTTPAPETLDSAAIAKIGEHLRTLEPVDTSILLSIFPETALSMKKTNLKGSEEPIPLNEFEAEYKEGNKAVTIHIIDGGNTTNDAYMTTQYYLNAIYLSNFDNKSYEIEKVETINNIKVYENQLNSDGETRSNMSFVVNNRFGIEINGINVNLEKLKPVLNTLNLTKLK